MGLWSELTGDRSELPVLGRPSQRLDVRIDVRPMDGAGIIECALDEIARLIEAELVGDRLCGLKVPD
jgi:hypothetical protein